jgi:MAF protein
MSPRRRDLLQRLGLAFVVRPAHVDEDGLEAAFAGPRAALAEHLAEQKARTIAATFAPDVPAVIIAADTTVLLDGQILGKPRDAAEARSMLQRLRGRTHQVYTGLVVLATATGQHLSRTVMTPVTMRAYTDAEIERYIATGDPFDKAGSYAIQHPLFQPVARIQGCATNVIGLPLCTLALLLQVVGMTVKPPERSAGACGWDNRCLPDATTDLFAGGDAPDPAP